MCQRFNMSGFYLFPLFIPSFITRVISWAVLLIIIISKENNLSWQSWQVWNHINIFFFQVCLVLLASALVISYFFNILKPLTLQIFPKLHSVLLGLCLPSLPALDIEVNTLSTLSHSIVLSLESSLLYKFCCLLGKILSLACVHHLIPQCMPILDYCHSVESVRHGYQIK